MQQPLPTDIPYKKQNTFYLAQRRVTDIIFSFLLIVLLLPLILVICLTTLILDGQPLFFRQIRTGRNGQPFMMWKFRTMNRSKRPSKKQESLQWTAGVPDDFVFKSSVQQGLTKTGALLRKYSLDELPQLFNILRGDMSFIGPRPDVPEITCCYNDRQRQRLALRPGITGLAQVSGRSNMNHGQKIFYDLHYVQHYNLLLDIKILLLTVIKVLKADGAY